MRARKILVAAIGLGIAMPVQALAGEGGSFRLKVSIDSVCEIDAKLKPVVPGASGTVGTVTEYCNTGDGYLLTAEHRPLAKNEMVELRLNRKAFALNPSGLTTIANRRGPVKRASAIDLDEANLNEPVVLTVSISYL
jgi:hypothetical protein